MARKKQILGGLAAAVLIILGLAAWSQAAFWKNSMTIFQHSAQVIPGNFPAWCNLGQTKLQAGDLDGAILCYERALQIDPQNVTAMELIGIAYMKKGRYDLAENWYRRALSLEPDRVTAMVNLGEACRRRGRLDEAMRRLEKAVKIAPGNHLARIFLGKVFADRGAFCASSGRREDAVLYYKKAIELRPDSTGAMNNLASVYLEAGDLDRAKSLFSRVLSLDPKNIPASYNMACVFSMANRPRESLVWMKRAMALGFHDRDSAEKDPDLENLRNSPGYRELWSPKGARTK